MWSEVKKKIIDNHTWKNRGTRYEMNEMLRDAYNTELCREIQEEEETNEEPQMKEYIYKLQN